jgi:putative lipase involved disintegration of autophagic bodies
MKGDTYNFNYYQKIFNPKTYDKCKDCEVHAGFYDTYLSIRDDMVNYVLDLKDKNPTAEIHVTGHSQGAALAVLFS